MRKLKRQLLLGFAALFFNVAVVAETIWFPTDGDVNRLDFSQTTPFVPDDDFYILDDSVVGNLEGATSSLQLGDSDLLRFEPVGGTTDWLITRSDGDTVTLNDSNNFISAELGDDTFSIEDDFANQGPNLWVLDFGSGAILQVVDVIPIPPSAILFGSAVIGLIVVGRRKRLLVMREFDTYSARAHGFAQ